MINVQPDRQKFLNILLRRNKCTFASHSVVVIPLSYGIQQHIDKYP
jgi:hypothetical protein